MNNTHSIYHYTYRITNIVEKKHYYGSRTSKIEPEKDLGIIYYSSSSNKDFLSDQKLNSKNYKYKIIKTYNSREEAIALEIKLQKKFNVGLNESFYNKAIQTATGFDVTNKRWSISDEARLKRSGINNVSKREDVRKKISESKKGNNNPNKSGDIIRGRKKYNDGIKNYMIYIDDPRIEELGLIPGETNDVKNKKRNTKRINVNNHDIATLFNIESFTTERIHKQEKQKYHVGINKQIFCPRCNIELRANNTAIEHFKVCINE